MAGGRILITGATGLIGGYVADFLLYMNDRWGLGADITVAATSVEKLQRRFGDVAARFVAVDFSQLVGRLGDFDFIIHTASPASPDAYKNNPVGVMRANILGTMAVLDGARETSAQVLFVSSGEVYGHNVDARPFVEGDLGVIDAKVARSCYPEAKRACETLCASYVAQYGVDARVVRLSHVYGPRINPDNNRADALFLRAVAQGKDIVLASDGAQRRSWCYVADAAAGILCVMLRGRSGDVYNVAGDVGTLREYAQVLADAAGVRVTVNDSVRAVNSDSVLSADKLRLLGWQPMYDLKRGVQNTLYFYSGALYIS